ncbi:MAG: MarR family transcriptional regulator [Fibrobacterota bacterium]|nr:MarR family transcriptional regulator [Fibrobacterota bacterium]
MSNPSPVQAELPLWLQLNKVSKKYMDALAAKLGHIGIRRHYFLLVAIGEGKGTLTQQDLADLLETDKVTMVGILDALAKAGFIRRTPSKEDRRKHLIVLTPKAERYLPKIRKVISELNRKALFGMPESLALHFGSALASMKSELEKAIKEAKPSESESDAPKPGRKPRKKASAGQRP